MRRQVKQKREIAVRSSSMPVDCFPFRNMLILHCIEMEKWIELIFSMVFSIFSSWLIFHCVVKEFGYLQ